MGTASGGGEWIAILLYFALVIGVGVYFFIRATGPWRSRAVMTLIMYGVTVMIEWFGAASTPA